MPLVRALPYKAKGRARTKGAAQNLTAAGRRGGARAAHPAAEPNRSIS